MLTMSTRSTRGGGGGTKPKISPSTDSNDEEGAVGGATGLLLLTLSTHKDDLVSDREGIKSSRKPIGSRATADTLPAVIVTRTTPADTASQKFVPDQDEDARSLASSFRSMGRFGDEAQPPTFVPAVTDQRRRSCYRVMPDNNDYQLSDDEVDFRMSRPLTAAALLNTMKRWDLSFSGRPGEDIEDFLTRVDEGRASLPVRDRELLKAIPFFLRTPPL